MSALESRITDVLVAHKWRGESLGCGCRWNWPNERTYACGEDERITKAHAEHVAGEIIAALNLTELLTEIRHRCTDFTPDPSLADEILSILDGWERTE